MEKNDKEILISIIVPVYNGEKYIKECIDSILSSSLKNYELIIVDDGSTDKTRDIVNNYLNINNLMGGGISLIIQTNRGVSAARNNGLNQAKGKWITFVDADDIVQPQFLEYILNSTSMHPSAQMVQAGCMNYRDGEIENTEQSYSDIITRDSSLIFNGIRGLTFSKLFLRSVIEEHNLRFDENMPLAEDLAFTLDYIYYIETVIFSSEKGYLYRRHRESVTQKNDIRPYYVYLSCFYHLYNSMMRYIERKNLKNRDQIKRKKQIGGNLFYAILSLYLNKMPRKERLFHLKKDFSKQQYSLLTYKPFGFSIKHLVCIPLVLGFYSTFDFIVSLIVKAKYTN